MKVYGPYINKENRRFVIIYYDNGKKKTTSYARWLVEQKLGRTLTKEETVDHNDRNKLNDDLSNLVIRDPISHLKLDERRVKKVEIICVACGHKAQKVAGYLKHNAKQGKSGPFCSKRCSGMYGQEIRFGKREKLPIHKYIERREYFYLNKSRNVGTEDKTFSKNVA